MRLHRKVCFVTGAGSGIGRAVALRFAREGGTVVVADLDAAAARGVTAEIIATGGLATAMTVDVTHEQQVDDAVDRTVEQHGGVDVLVSNAGIQIVHSLQDYLFADWKRVLAVHLDGAFLTTRACVRHMQTAHRGGSIVYMASVHSKDASVDKSAYVTAKHGLIGLCKAVAKEGAAWGIRANAVCPGLVMTPLVDRQLPAMAAALGMSEEAVLVRLLSDTADGQPTTLDEVAEATVMFASFEGNALTGQSLVVSHGRAMQ